ncbi:MAG: N-acetylmuramic acid 6-phosphate etherase [Sulfitobacter sp.]
MLLNTTETLPEGEAVDAMPTLEAAGALLDGHKAALAAVDAAAGQIAEGARAISAALRACKTLHYAAAGSSGLMALADACEIPGTFGVPARLIRIHMAGGVPVDGHMPGDTEDDTKANQIVEDAIAAGDVVVVLTASGSTPYALDIATRAKGKGASVVGIANNPNTPLLELADISICLATPPEVLAGSTRMGAGTAQKAALNMMSTLVGIELGHVYQGMMVNVVADNAKLIARTSRMITDIAGVSMAEAKEALARSGGHTKTAILVAAGCAPVEAVGLIERCDGHLGRCFKILNKRNDVKVN